MNCTIQLTITRCDYLQFVIWLLDLTDYGIDACFDPTFSSPLIRTWGGDHLVVPLTPPPFYFNFGSRKWNFSVTCRVSSSISNCLSELILRFGIAFIFRFLDVVYCFLVRIFRDFSSFSARIKAFVIRWCLLSTPTEILIQLLFYFSILLRTFSSTEILSNFSPNTPRDSSESTS